MIWRNVALCFCVACGNLPAEVGEAGGDATTAETCPPSCVPSNASSRCADFAEKTGSVCCCCEGDAGEAIDVCR